MNQISQHFDRISSSYDYYKSKNWYYYQGLKNLYQDLIPQQSRVLDYGCGTGDILVDLKPQYGLGIDISQEMIRLAQVKHQKKANIEFQAGTIEELAPRLLSQSFDYIFLADVIEHLENVSNTLKNINQVAKSNTQLIISMANPGWEPLLLILEKLKLKMPEGPHRRMSLKELEALLIKNDFKIMAKGYRLLLPVFVPFLSNLINRYFCRIPLLRKCGLIIFIQCQKTT